jgi:hypothetical protein
MKRFLIILITAGLIFQSCNDPWEDRFNSELLTDQTVWELLNQDQDYSDFVQLLKETGYDTTLQRTTVFTVFVPEKSSLQDAKALTIEEKTSLIGFHISNSVVYSSDVKGVTPVKTLGGKQLFLDIMGEELMVNQDSRVLQRDLRAVNGVIHEIEKPQEIKPNILEVIQNDTSFSQIAEFILDGTSLLFDEVNSIQVGIDSIGQTIYDSVWISTNDFFNQYADMSSEDESFTVVFADNTLLDTTLNGVYRIGYLTTLPWYIFRGIYTEDDLSTGIVSVGGKMRNFAKEGFGYFETASNGRIFKLNDLSGLNIPTTLTWEFTEVSDFDSIRGTKTTDYKPFIDQLEEIKVSNLDGSFIDFKYESKPGFLNRDQLKILTEGGTDVSIEFTLPSILPGKYRLSINALIRISDGITYDAYFNGRMISSGNDFNEGTYKNQTREIGTVIIESSEENSFRIDIKDSSGANKYCHIDYLLFEPIK